ncbi:MAG: alpha/beta hydrolase family protein, partial [Actinomycetota bacterium]|nr:alpha/beta hydrolase family protein [Actinomycetota bacterium]
AGLALPTSVRGLDAMLTHLSPHQLVALGSVPGPWGIGRVLRPDVLWRLGTYRNALAVAAALAAGPPAFLMAYDATAYAKRSVPEGRAAVAYGDPDAADDVALCVPGLESRVASLDGVSGDATALWAEASAADPSRRTAVVAWQGYDAPEWATVAGQGRAEAGGALLAADVHALTVTHDVGDPRVTVVGHSYGSTTTGLALQHHGLASDVDEVVLIGSPGVGGGAQGVADLGLRPDQLHVGTASRDLINATSNTLLGANPVDPGFGGERFKAESLDRDGPGVLDLIGVTDHSRYYDPGSESLYSLADITSGHADQLGEHDMLAASPSRARTVLDPLPISPLPPGLRLPGLPPVLPQLPAPPGLPALPGLPSLPGLPVVPSPLDPGWSPLRGPSTTYVDPELTREPTGGHVHRVA